MDGRDKSKPTVAGGFFIALLTVAGTLVGGMMGQPSIGLLGGFALGVAVAIALWLREKPR